MKKYFLGAFCGALLFVPIFAGAVPSRDPEITELKSQVKKVTQSYRRYRIRYEAAARGYRIYKQRSRQLENVLAPIKIQARKMDKVLEHHALKGQGLDFAKAAKFYGLQNPYLSASIAGVESTFGDCCFRDHNAWGWYCRRSFSSWEESIFAHAEYLQRPRSSKGYGWNNPKSSWSMIGYCVPENGWRGKVASIESSIRSGP